MTVNTRRILYVDGDRDARLLIQTLLARDALHVCESAEQAKVLARRNRYDIYIVGEAAADSGALELCAWLQRVDARTPIVFCSSNVSATHQQRALEAGALRFQPKPLEGPLLKATLSLLLKLGEIESRRAIIAEQQAILEELIARSIRACEAASFARSPDALDWMLRVKGYRAFRDAGGNRANFERLWPETLQRASGSAV